MQTHDSEQSHPSRDTLRQTEGSFGGGLVVASIQAIVGISLMFPIAMLVFGGNEAAKARAAITFLIISYSANGLFGWAIPYGLPISIRRSFIQEYSLIGGILLIAGVLIGVVLADSLVWYIVAYAFLPHGLLILANGIRLRFWHTRRSRNNEEKRASTP